MLDIDALANVAVFLCFAISLTLILTTLLSKDKEDDER